MKKIIALFMALAFLVPAGVAGNVAMAPPAEAGTPSVLSNLKASNRAIKVCPDMVWTWEKGNHCRNNAWRWLRPGQQTLRDFGWAQVEGMIVDAGCYVVMVGTSNRYFDRRGLSTSKQYNISVLTGSTVLVVCNPNGTF